MINQNKYIIRVRVFERITNKQNKTDHPKKKDQLMIKIYYLKNDTQTNNLQNKTVLEKRQMVSAKVNNKRSKNKPSLPCLSSLIQCDKNAPLLDDQVYIQNMPRRNSSNHVQVHKDNIVQIISKAHNGNSHQKTIPIQQLIAPQQKQQQTNKKSPPRKAITEAINYNNHNHNNNNRKPSIQQPPTTKHYHQKRRLTQASQEQTFSLNKKLNNQALSKDFLCNIVKEWGHFTEVQEVISQRTKLKLWKTPRPQQPHKASSSSHQSQDIDDLRKNKSLMEQHFNLFIQSRKNKMQGVNEKRRTSIMRAVFTNNDHSIPKVQPSNNYNYNHNNTNKLSPLTIDIDNNTNIVSQPSRQRENRIQNGSVNVRRLSMMQNNDKKQYYLRLMYGPQVKLLPKLFDEGSRGRNFNWTKLDKDVFDSTKRVRCDGI